MSLNFLRYGDHSTETEWRDLLSDRGNILVKIMAHLAAVDAAGGVRENRPLTHAERLGGNPVAAELYWYQMDDVGVVYAYDGRDVVIASIGIADDLHARNLLIDAATARIDHVRPSPA